MTPIRMLLSGSLQVGFFAQHERGVELGIKSLPMAKEIKKIAMNGARAVQELYSEKESCNLRTGSP